VELAVQSQKGLDIFARLHLITELIQLVKLLAAKSWQTLAEKEWL
jgi:hypothetical protein